MTIQQAETIEFVVHEPVDNEVLLVMVQAEEWGDSGHQLPALQAKLSTYHSYATEGLAKDYPAFSGKRVHVQLRSSTPTGTRELEFLRIVAKLYLQPAGIRLSWQVIDEGGVHDI